MRRLLPLLAVLALLVGGWQSATLATPFVPASPPMAAEAAMDCHGEVEEKQDLAKSDRMPCCADSCPDGCMTQCVAIAVLPALAETADRALAADLYPMRQSVHAPADMGMQDRPPRPFA
jgi:hypothetical protein